MRQSLMQFGIDDIVACDDALADAAVALERR